MSNYYSNAPVNDKEKYEIYCEKLDAAILDKDVYNIGIIAPYGAGKSSLIKTYVENEGKSRKITNISLASFNDDVLDSKALDKDEKEKRIELSILQQIIYSKKSNEFPNSRISRVENKGKFIGLYPTLIFLTYIILGFLSIYFYLLSNKDLKNPLFIIFASLSLLPLFLIILYLSKHLYIKKIKAFDIEIEAEKNNGNASILNRFIDEIIYFFSVTETEILVIEDLDRFDNLSIFTKLREINTIINNSESIKQKVTFIYCIKDDLFDDNLERAKFFEYVLSLIPVLSIKNANEHICKMNNRLNKNMALDSDFINKIKFFVDDHRLLNNTFNDYELYWKELKFDEKNNVTNEKLFSMMLYKNKSPKDFALMQKNKGEIIKLFDSKKEIVKEINTESDAKIKQLKKEISDANNNYLNSFDDLKKIFRGFLCGRYDSGGYQTKTIGYDQFDTFQDKDVVVKVNIGGNQYYSTIKKFEESEKKDFYKIECNIKEEKENVIKRLNDEISKIKNDILEVKKLTIEQLINKYDAAKTFLSEKYSDTLLIFLVSNGYIAEDYLNYAVADTKSMLSMIDQEYITNILLTRGDNYDLNLFNIENILIELPKECFNYTYSLNINLVNYLFKEENKHQDIISQIIQLLNKNENDCQKFIVLYIEKYGVDKFICLICNKYNPNIDNIIYSDELNLDGKKLIINLILKIDNDIISEYNIDDKLGHYISKLNPVHFNVADNAPKLEFIKVAFEDIKELSCDELDEINKYNLYDINYDNISILLNNYRYPVLFSTAYEKLNINDYMKNNINDLYLCMEDQCFKGNSSSTISNILKLEEFTYKLDLIEKIDIKFEELTCFSKEVLTNIVSKGKYEVNWNNLNYIYCLNEIKIDLSKVVNDNYMRLANEEIDGYEIKKEILKFEIKKEILNSYHNNFALDNNGYNDTNITELIKVGKISVKDYKILNYYPKSLSMWYELNINTWNITNISYSEDIALSLLESNIPNEKIIEFIDLYIDKTKEFNKLDAFYELCNKKNIILPDNLYLEVVLRYNENDSISDSAFFKIKNIECFKKYEIIHRLFREIPEVKNLNENNPKIEFEILDKRYLNFITKYKQRKIIDFDLDNNKVINFRLFDD